MLLDAPLRGTIHIDARYYPNRAGAWTRPSGNHEAAMNHDFGPSSLSVEPTVTWPGGEGIPAGRYVNFHTGIDLAQSGCGYDVLAAGAGKVLSSYRNSSGAEVIVIGHGGGFQTRYVHMSKRLVIKGALVTAGQKIGLTGATGMATGCHLHFAVTKSGDPVDPWRRLRQNTSVDPDAPAPTPAPQESDMPALTDYLPGQTAKVGHATFDVNVRPTPTLTSTPIRRVPAGESEDWLVIGWVKGDMTSASDQWLARWDGGGWEYAHASTVLSGPKATSAPVDTEALTAPLEARIAAMKAKAATFAADLADD